LNKQNINRNRRTDSRFDSRFDSNLNARFDSRFNSNANGRFAGPYIRTSVSHSSCYQIPQKCGYFMWSENFCNSAQNSAAYGKLWTLRMTSTPLKNNVFWK